MTSKMKKYDFVARSSKSTQKYGTEMDYHTFLKFINLPFETQINNISKINIYENTKSMEYLSFSAVKVA